MSEDRPTAYGTPPDLTVLHSLRCLGFVTTPAVVAATGLDESTVESELIDLARAGLVTHTPGHFGGWGLSDAGRDADAVRIAAELDRAGARSAVTAAYEVFIRLNPELLDLCTAWQLRTGGGAGSTMTANDHSDPAYDARVLDLFTELDRRVGPVCADLSAVLARFGCYQGRLSGALARARAGERDYLTDHPASYHAVWFQLHEDLLATLGRPRWPSR
jgi:hypothetical protein